MSFLYLYCFFLWCETEEDSHKHKGEPYKNKISPTDFGGDVSENVGRYCRTEITEKVESTRCGGNHSRVFQGGTIKTPKHCIGEF